MSGENGQQPLAFKGTGNPPILGQPFELIGWYVTAVLRCHCSADKPPVVIPEGAAGVCPRCSLQYVIAGKIAHPTQGLALQIGMHKPGQTPADPPPGLIGG